MPRSTNPGEDGRPDLTPDALAERVMSRGVGPGSSTLMDGYLGSSDKPGVVRLFCTPDFSSYVEVPADDVRHREQIVPLDGGAPGSRLWVSSTAAIHRHTTTSEELQAGFLNGPLAQAGMTHATSSAAVQSGFLYSPSEPTKYQTLNQHSPACATMGYPNPGNCGHSAGCGPSAANNGPLCPTGAWVCGGPPNSGRLTCVPISAKGTGCTS